MELFKFVKEEDNKWYIVLPEWTGSKEDLEMVMGADTLLDIVAQGEYEVYMNISDKEIPDYTFVLTFLREEFEGATYILNSEMFEFEVWLCYVTKFVFNKFPEKIWLK